MSTNVNTETTDKTEPTKKTFAIWLLIIMMLVLAHMCIIGLTYGSPSPTVKTIPMSFGFKGKIAKQLTFDKEYQWHRMGDVWIFPIFFLTILGARAWIMGNIPEQAGNKGEEEVINPKANARTGLYIGITAGIIIGTVIDILAGTKSHCLGESALCACYVCCAVAFILYLVERSGQMKDAFRAGSRLIIGSTAGVFLCIGCWWGIMTGIAIASWICAAMFIGKVVAALVLTVVSRLTSSKGKPTLKMSPLVQTLQR